MDSESKDILKSIYFDPKSPGSFASAQILQKVLKNDHGRNVPLKHIQAWLVDKRPHYLHKPARQHFLRNSTYISRLDEQWQADLLFLPDLAKFNDGISCHLIVIDVLSRYGWIEPMKNKTAVETSRGMQSILSRANPRKPEKLQTDDGKEFFNAIFNTLMKKFNIYHFSTKSDMKAALAERFIKTVKEKIYKYLSAKPTNNRYIDVLQDLVTSYNHTYHSSIRMAPASVNKCNSGKVLWNLFHHLWAKDRGNVKEKFAEGDFVRISSRNAPLSKRYKGNWTEEIFQINKVKQSIPLRVYKLVDLKGEPIIGSFYAHELQKARQSTKEDLWQVETVLKSRDVFVKRRGKNRLSHKEYFVKWHGYPDSFNEWVHEKDIKNTGST